MKILKFKFINTKLLPSLYKVVLDGLREKVLALLTCLCVCYSHIAFGYQLSDAVESTLEYNQQIKAIQEDVVKAKADLAKSVTNFLPDISLNKTQDKRFFNRNDIGIIESDSENLRLSMTLFESGGKFANFKANKNALRATKYSYKSQLENIILNSISAYEKYIIDREILEISYTRTELLKTQLELNQIRFEYGDIPKTDLLQAEAGYANSISLLEIAKGNLSTSKATLEGITYDTSIPENVSSITHDAIDHLIPDTLEALLEETMANNPSLIAARYSLESARAGVYITAAGILPRITGSVEFFQDIPGSLSFNAGNSRLKGKRATVGFSIPLLPSGGGGFFDVKKSYSDKKSSAARLQQAKNDTETLAVRLWSQYNSAEASRISAKKTVEADKKTLEGFEEEAKEGTRDIIQLLEVEQRYYESQVRYREAIQQKIVAAFQILALLGRLEELDYNGI